MMRMISIYLWFSMGVSLCFAQEEVGVITVADLRKSKVVGELGLALGTVTQVEVEVVSGDVTRRKANRGRYLLKVISVGGKALKEFPVMKFGLLREGDRKIATTPFELYELKFGKKALSLETEEIQELEKEYVGKKMKLRVYESGRFSGVPSALPDGVVWQGGSFGFSTSLTVVKIE